MSFNEFFASLQEARRRTGTQRNGAWYRGISDGRFTLTSCLLKHRNRHFDAEINMFADFWTMVEGVEIKDSWKRLSFMRHHGVPTRLLDRTTDLNIALYFAVLASNGSGLVILAYGS
jgi:hypothetical protein